MKICRKCGKEKSLDDFSPNNRVKDGRQSYCKSCYSTLSGAARERRKQSDPEGYKKARRQSYLNYVAKHPDKIKAGNISRHGIKLENFQERLAKQDHACAVCRRDNIGKGRGRLHIDHDHSCCPGPKSCGKCVRGLLCTYCNTGLGGLRDNPAIILNALTYLSQGVVNA